MMGAPGLNVLSEGEQIDPQILVDLQTLGYPHVRIDVQGLDLETTLRRAKEVIGMGIQPICIVNSAAQASVLFPTGALVEVGNEPDIERFLLKHFGSFNHHMRVVEDCVALALEEDGDEEERKVYVGAVSNLTKHERNRGLRFLEHYPWHRWTSEKHRRVVAASAHFYAVDLDPETPHAGFSSNKAAVDLMKDIIDGPRPMAITEIGLRDGRNGLSEEQVAERLPRMRQFFAEQGFEIVSAYGLNDGEDRPGQYDPENHYGFRRLDGSWKPVARTFADTNSSGERP